MNNIVGNHQCISSCPQCGSPIWIDLGIEKNYKETPQHIFSCQCRLAKIEDNGSNDYKIGPFDNYRIDPMDYYYPTDPIPTHRYPNHSFPTHIFPSIYGIFVNSERFVNGSSASL